MECRRIKVMCWRCWLLLLVVVQRFFWACLATSNPCQGIDDIGKVSYGSFTFLTCEPNPNYQGSQTGTFWWFQNEMQLSDLPEKEPHLMFNNAILDVGFIDSGREGMYECSYQRNSDPSSRVNGTSSPRCLIVRGIPKFVACPEQGESEDRCEPGGEIPFYTDGELGLQVDVKYIGAGKSGSVFEIVGFSVSRGVSETLLVCTTMVPSDNSEPVNFNCNPTNGDVEGRINGNVSTDRKTYVNASFVINPASVDDSGDYTVRVTARDMSDVTDAMASTVTMGTTHTTITLVVSASATVHPPMPTSSVAIPGISSTSAAVRSTSTNSMVQASPTSTVPEDSSSDRNDAIIIGVSVVAGVIILILLVGIVSVCLFILHGMCPKLKKQIMDNVRLIRMKTNGREDIITVITEGTTMQNAKAYSQPDFELTEDKNSKPAVV